MQRGSTIDEFVFIMGANSSKKSKAAAPYRNYDSPYGCVSSPQQQQRPYYTCDQQIPPPQLPTTCGYPPYPNPSQNSITISDHYHHQTSSQISQSNRKRLQRTYSRIADEYKTFEEVSAALADAGLESSNLIVGIDFTKSNEWTGRRSYNLLNLHHISDQMNPYEQAISIIGRSLSSFDEDNLIPCFGFGDASTHDQDVFSFYPDGRPCNGFEEVLSRYREIVPQLKLSGPTSFAPIIEIAMTTVEESGGQYHVLLIIADGQVAQSGNTAAGRFGLQERPIVDLIIRASQYPLSIVVVGVGDGPWDMMKKFEDGIPERAFDNFRFVNFTEIMLKKKEQMRKEKEFAVTALMEIPLQYRATLELGILGHPTGGSPGRAALPTPNGTYRGISSSFDQINSTNTEATSSAASLVDDDMLCPICLDRSKVMAFGCGHQVCCVCGPRLPACPICRAKIEIRVMLRGDNEMICKGELFEFQEIVINGEEPTSGEEAHEQEEDGGL